MAYLLNIISYHFYPCFHATAITVTKQDCLLVEGGSFGSYARLTLTFTQWPWPRCPGYQNEVSRSRLQKLEREHHRHTSDSCDQTQFWSRGARHCFSDTDMTHHAANAMRSHWTRREEMRLGRSGTAMGRVIAAVTNHIILQVVEPKTKIARILTCENSKLGNRNDSKTW